MFKWSIWSLVLALGCFIIATFSALLMCFAGVDTHVMGGSAVLTGFLLNAVGLVSGAVGVFTSQGHRRGCAILAVVHILPPFLFFQFNLGLYVVGL